MTRDRPILFSPPMILALLREVDRPGTGKTQTRRSINPQPRLAPHHEPVRVEKRGERGWVWMVHTDRPSYAFAMGDWKAPYAVGDRLWVREAWKTHAAYDDISPAAMGGDEAILYVADGAHQTWGYPAISKIGRFRQGMHMPRWASRLTLIVTDVRVQRLQEISEVDAIAEGIASLPSGRYHCGHDEDGEITCKSPVTAYAWLWDRLNAKRGYDWCTNPWVVAVTFRPIAGNIDQIGAS